MKKKQVKIKDIFVPIYNTEITLALGDKKQCNKKLQKKFNNKEQDFINSDNYALTLKLLDSDGIPSIVIWLSPKAIKSKHKLNTISHEAFHTTHHILKIAGLELSDETQEAYCYLLGWIVDKITNEIT